MAEFSLEAAQNYIMALCHDLKSPIAGIRGWVELIKRSGVLDQDSIAAADRIFFLTEEMLTAINGAQVTSHAAFKELDESRDRASLTGELERLFEALSSNLNDRAREVMDLARQLASQTQLSENQIKFAQRVAQSAEFMAEMVTELGKRKWADDQKRSSDIESSSRG